MRKYHRTDGYKWDKKKAEKVKRGYIEFRKEARRENWKGMGYDIGRLLKHEQSTYKGMKKHTEAMKGVCLDIVEEKCPDIIEIKKAFGAPDLPPKHEDLPFKEAFDPLGRNKKLVGGEDVWSFHRYHEGCQNGRVVTDKSESGNPSDGQYDEPCLARGTTNVYGSIEDGVRHHCSVKMMHDFEFLAFKDTRYRFTPEWLISGIVTLWGSDDVVAFENAARVTISVSVWGQEKDSHSPVRLYNRSIPVVPKVESNETTETGDNPFAEVRLDEWERVTVTVCCEIYVEARNTARAEIDMGSTEDLFFSAPRLRIDYVSRTIPLYDTPEMVEVIIPPELPERQFPPIPPIDGNGLPFDL